MPEVGIVVPVYNGMPYVVETIDAIRAQSLPDWRCVLVDDGSTDNSLAACRTASEADERIVLLRQPNAGVSVARNNGLAELSDCRFVAFMDQDDIWHPQALETLLSAARQRGVIGAHCVAQTIDLNGNVVPGFDGYMRARSRPGPRRFQPLRPDEPTTLDSALFVNRVYPPGVLLARKAAYDAAGSFDPRYRAVQDWDMLIRLLLCGDIAFVDTCLVGYRRHSRNESMSLARNVEETRALHTAMWNMLEPAFGRRRLKSWWRQWELLKLGEARSDSRGVRRLARLAVHAYRFVRGWPAEGRIG